MRRAWLAGLFVLASCGPSSGGDAGVDAGAPGSAALPALEPCPAGWRAIGTPVICEPWPETGRATCAPHEAHFPGEPGCQRIGAACPADGWPAELPSTGVVYVRSDVPFGGNGTRSAPFQTIGEALAASPSIIAVAAGTYDEAVFLDRSVSIVGACAERTILTSSVRSSSAPTIYVEALGARLFDVTVGGDRPALIAGPDASVELDHVIVRGAEIAAIVALSASTVDASDLLIQGTRGEADTGAYGFAMQIEPGARVELRRAAILENRGAGMIASGAPSEIVLEDVVIADTLVSASGDGDGRGIEIGGGAILRASRLVLEANAGRALNVFDPNTQVTLEDSRILRSREIQSEDGARAILRRVGISDGLGGAIAVNSGGLATIEDVVIARVGAHELAFGRGINAQVGSQIDGTRVFIDEASELGVFASGDGTQVALSDVTVLGTRPRTSDGRGGHAALALEGARLSLTRARIERASEAGLVASGVGSQLSLTATAVRGTLARELDGRYGLGVVVELGARLEALGLNVEDCRDTGVFVTNPGTEADLTGVVVQRTLERACAQTTCTDYTFGFGVATTDGAHLAMRDFVVADNAICGLMLAESGTMDLARGEVRGHPIGANVQSEGFDVARISSDVVYRDNDRNLDSSAALGVPEPPSPL